MEWMDVRLGVKAARLRTVPFAAILAVQAYPVLVMSAGKQLF
jgi:hypothetical protein